MKLDGFPGVLKRKNIRGPFYSYKPTPEQEEWILAQYANENILVGDIAETIGTATHYVNRLGHSHGLKRDRGVVRRRANRRRIEERAHASVNALPFIPDKDLIAIVNEDNEPRTIGHCIGERCFNYASPSCYCQMLNPATGRMQRQHRTECNAVF